MRSLHYTCLVLTIIGAINWGLWGLFQFDLVASLLDGQTGTASRIVYSLVGLAGVVLIFTASERKDRLERREGRTLRSAA